MSSGDGTSGNATAGSAATPGFIISGLLGDGGALLAAQQLGLDRAVAVKRLPVADAADPEARARFRAEIGLVGMLEHPGIIPVYQAGEDAAGVPFYALRQVHGQPWSQRLGSGQDHEEDDLDVLERVAEALAYAHDRGIAHGALDPAVVILGEHGEVLLTGWDAAARSDEARQADLGRLAGLLVRIWPRIPPPEATTAAGFLAGLRDLRRQSASHRLLLRAQGHRDAALAGGGLEDWARARFAGAEAARLHPSAAATALGRELALGYAAAAGCGGDLALALAVLDATDPGQADAAQRCRAAIVRRGRRAATVRRLALATLALALLFGAVLAVTTWRAESGRRQARAAETEAERQRVATEADAYACTLAAAADQLAGGRAELAQPLLASCPAVHRGWEWSRLQHLAGRWLPVLALGGADQAQPIAVDGGWIAAPHGATDIGLWRRAGAPERILACAVRPELIALDPHGDRLLTLQDGNLACRALPDGHELWQVPLAMPADDLLVLSDRRILALQDPSGETAHWRPISPEGVLGEIGDLPPHAHSWTRDGDGFLLASVTVVPKKTNTIHVLRLPGSPGGAAQELAVRSNAWILALLGDTRPRLMLVSYVNGHCGSASLDQPSPSEWLNELHYLGNGAFSRDGSYFAGVSHDRLSVLIHHRTGSRPPQRLQPPEPVHWLRFTDDGAILILGGKRTVRLVPVRPDPPWQEVAGSLPSTPSGAVTAVGRNLRFADGRFGDLQHEADITAIATDGARVFSGDATGILAVWDAGRARRLWHERIGSGPIDAIVPGQPLRVRSGGRVLAVPDGP